MPLSKEIRNSILRPTLNIVPPALGVIIFTSLYTFVLKVYPRRITLCHELLDVPRPA
jgi:hypothetical protein